MGEKYYVIENTPVEDENLNPNDFWDMYDDETDISTLSLFLMDDEFDMGQRVTLVV